jgi:hypothetical protein
MRDDGVGREALVFAGLRVDGDELDVTQTRGGRRLARDGQCTLVAVDADDAAAAWRERQSETPAAGADVEHGLAGEALVREQLQERGADAARGLIGCHGRPVIR